MCDTLGTTLHLTQMMFPTTPSKLANTHKHGLIHPEYSKAPEGTAMEPTEADRLMTPHT